MKTIEICNENNTMIERFTRALEKTISQEQYFVNRIFIF